MTSASLIEKSRIYTKIKNGNGVLRQKTYKFCRFKNDRVILNTENDFCLKASCKKYYS